MIKDLAELKALKQRLKSRAEAAMKAEQERREREREANLFRNSVGEVAPLRTPAISTVLIILRIASTAALSAKSFCPRPTQGAAARAAVSVTRISSRAKLRSGIAIIRELLSRQGPVAARQSLDNHDQRGKPDR